MKKIIFLYFILGIIAVIIGILIFSWLYTPKINYSCNVDSDCVIKDIGVYCSQRMCVNKDSDSNRFFIGIKNRIKSLISGPIFCMLGESAMDGCRCIENKCRTTFQGKLNPSY